MNSGELRFLITQSCNYSCYFCHREGQVKYVSDLMTPDDYDFLYNVTKKYYNKNTCTITGGEPLVRKDVLDIAEKLYLSGAKITLVTNGYCLPEKALIGNYIDKINISLHTLDDTNYSRIIGQKDRLHKVIFGLKMFRKMYPEVEICFNVAITERINDSEEEFMKIVRFAEKIDANVKAIELFPKDTIGFVNIDKIREILINNDYMPIFSNTRKENYSNGKHVVSLTKIFCAIACEKKNPEGYCRQNNDLFVSPNGKIKMCREKDTEISILCEIKNRDEKGLIKKLDQAYTLLGNGCLYND